MGGDIPPDQAFELKVIFLKELDAGYRQAREAQDRLLKNPKDPRALEVLRNFFHRIAGTAHAVDMSALGYLSAVCETASQMVIDGHISSPSKAIQLFSDGLAGVASQLEQGAPAPKVDKAQASAPLVAAGGMAHGESGIDDRTASAKILIIDDDPFSARLIDTCLRGAGFTASTCIDPENALTTIQTEAPDLIILDVVMPTVDGFDLCRRVRSDPALQLIPIIFVTRRGDLEQRIRGLEVGGNDYVCKPFEPQELVARVRSHLQRLSALRDMAIRDGLTRCYNHKYFKSRLEQEVQRAHRYSVELALGMIDIDHFKRLNDQHGHPAGDAVLAHLSNLLAASTRTTDVLARYGGEEFSILMIQAANAEAHIISNRVRERVAAHAFPVPPKSGSIELVKVPITVSVGVAQLEPNESAQSFLARADAALYEAKKNGRNQVRLAAPMQPARAEGGSEVPLPLTAGQDS
jgi:diguanylate cyclase (GGDEF)-like protein